MMNSKQFAWLYLVSNGMAGARHSYYGGYEQVDKSLPPLSWDKGLEQYKKIYLAQIKAHGVNWTKTKAPETGTHSIFNGTFADSGEEEHLEGVLVLNNGTKQNWIAEALEVKNVFDMMAAVHEAPEKFKQLFGEVA
jgi:hypothetical protein